MRQNLTCMFTQVAHCVAATRTPALLIVDCCLLCRLLQHQIRHSQLIVHKRVAATASAARDLRRICYFSVTRTLEQAIVFCSAGVALNCCYQTVASLLAGLTLTSVSAPAAKSSMTLGASPSEAANSSRISQGALPAAKNPPYSQQHKFVHAVNTRVNTHKI